MKVLERHSDDIALGLLFDCADGSLNLEKTLFVGAGVQKTVSISSSIVLYNSISIRLVSTNILFL